MAEKDKNKRKRPVTETASPNKRAAVAPSASTIKVEFVKADNQLHPVLASCPGLNAPSVTFKAYSAQKQNVHPTTTPTPASHSLLLQSSTHPKLDYVANADPDPRTDEYVGVFDPATSTLKVIPAHQVTLRSSLRSETVEVHQQNTARTLRAQREALGMEFGTKKAKKAIASKTVNAITGEAGKGVENAVLDSVKEASAALPIKEEQQDSILAAKPIPKPNLTTQNVDEVYPISRLVPSVDMRALAVKEWQDAVEKEEEVKLSSRFVANRLRSVVVREDVQLLKALKYLLLLLEFNNALEGGRGGGKKIPQKDKLRAKLSHWPDSLVENVRRRFAEGGEMNKWHVDNIMTHMAAISLLIDNWKTDTHDLREDLRLENKQMSQYFSELGCRVRNPTEKEQTDLKLGTKAQAAQRRFALLKLPLDFPKTRLPPRRR